MLAAGVVIGYGTVMRTPVFPSLIASRHSLPTFADALKYLADVVEPLGVEALPLADAGGRTLALPIRARIDLPRRDAAAMDGYALGGEAGTAMPPHWRIVEPQTGVETRIAAGQALRVATGAPLPEGAIRVLPIERAIVANGWVSLDGPPIERSHVRGQGSDLQRGEIALAAGRRIDPRALVAAAAADVATVTVRRRPRIGVLVRGDGLVAPGQAANDGQAVPDMLGEALSLFGVTWGGHPAETVRISEDPTAMTDAVTALYEAADVIVLAGGAAHGARDAAKTALAGQGLEMVFDGLAIRPGRPTWCGRIDGIPVLALPGNPTAAMTVARLLLAPLLARLCGDDVAAALSWEPMPLLAPVPPTGTREAFLCAAAEANGVRILDRSETTGQMLLASSDRLVARPAGGPALAAGTLVPTLRF